MPLADSDSVREAQHATPDSPTHASSLSARSPDAVEDDFTFIDVPPSEAEAPATETEATDLESVVPAEPVVEAKKEESITGTGSTIDSNTAVPLEDRPLTPAAEQHTQLESQQTQPQKPETEAEAEDCSDISDILEDNIVGVSSFEGGLEDNDLFAGDNKDEEQGEDETVMEGEFTAAKLPATVFRDPATGFHYTSKTLADNKDNLAYYEGGFIGVQGAVEAANYDASPLVSAPPKMIRVLSNDEAGEAIDALAHVEKHPCNHPLTAFSRDAIPAFEQFGAADAKKDRAAAYRVVAVSSNIESGVSSLVTAILQEQLMPAETPGLDPNDMGADDLPSFHTCFRVTVHLRYSKTPVYNLKLVTKDSPLFADTSRVNKWGKVKDGLTHADKSYTRDELRAILQEIHELYDGVYDPKSELHIYIATPTAVRMDLCELGSVKLAGLDTMTEVFVNEFDGKNRKRVPDHVLIVDNSFSDTLLNNAIIQKVRETVGSGPQEVSVVYTKSDYVDARALPALEDIIKTNNLNREMAPHMHFIAAGTLNEYGVLGDPSIPHYAADERQIHENFPDSYKPQVGTHVLARKLTLSALRKMLPDLHRAIAAAHADSSECYAEIQRLGMPVYLSRKQDKSRNADFSEFRQAHPKLNNAEAHNLWPILGCEYDVKHAVSEALVTLRAKHDEEMRKFLLDYVEELEALVESTERDIEAELSTLQEVADRAKKHELYSKGQAYTKRLQSVLASTAEACVRKDVAEGLLDILIKAVRSDESSVKLSRFAKLEQLISDAKGLVIDNILQPLSERVLAVAVECVPEGRKLFRLVKGQGHSTYILKKSPDYIDVSGALCEGVMSFVDSVAFDFFGIVFNEEVLDVTERADIMDERMKLAAQVNENDVAIHSLEKKIVFTISETHKQLDVACVADTDRKILQSLAANNNNLISIRQGIDISTEERLKAVLDVLAANTHVKRITLKGGQFTSDQARAELLSLLSSTASLQSITFDGCSFKDCQFEGLAETMISVTNLTLTDTCDVDDATKLSLASLASTSPLGFLTTTTSA